jgi:hypothetical protein
MSDLHVATYDGRPVPVPAGADPAVFAEFARQVLIVEGSCHFWLGKLQGNTGYGEFRYRMPGGAIRVTGAHRYAYDTFADEPARPKRQRTVTHPPMSESFLILAEPPRPEDLLPRENTEVRHRCDERLCAPVTKAAAATHLRIGDPTSNALDRESRGRGGRRRFGVRRHGADTRERTEVALAVQDAITTAVSLGLEPGAIIGAVDDVYRAGDPYHGQMALIALPDHRTLARLRLAQ